MPETPSFEDLLAEGEAVPVDGWDFSWFDGRASEQRPPWGYSRMLAARMPAAGAVLDVQTGGGEVLAEVLAQVPRRPAMVAATESWPPNLALARRNLSPFGGTVVEAADGAGLPFVAGSFALVVSRHPTVVLWDEIARVLAPGGTYVSQQIGAGSQRELAEFMMDPQPVSRPPDPQQVVAATHAAVAAAGLTVIDMRHAALRTEFHDIGAVVHFLRKVVWTVPDFTVDRYRYRLAALHDRIAADGPFVSHAQRLIVEARRPG